MARGDILLVSLPDSDKREKKGNRPAIAVQTDLGNSPMLMVIPITSSLGALRFSFTVEIKPSKQNGLTLPSVAMVFQMRAIDRKRIIRKIGQLESEYLVQVDAAIWQMLKPVQPDES
ncbi:MazF family transcriptional regulator [Leptolyngbya boryana NIES-2135]|jgi:mRNA interferase MazF|uniref:mRNA interferase n=1 Tax=Leptolyngbya boryana NIES-2135 TaxID=1973484 RepID=A0A1Z4JH95_LEPBY|nr:MULTISPECIES: type II toxin-antitoxin system PemK/MazF family toxin [Leptolyngbya]BAY56134.1 MazF family transcriptional regulator [Leptolyngbya boryana NIES-2135]MBD2366244.1 type II toxin-antitoxin system PemK/MazF family toxin [Leptolyngbya sp. FACHB-161]MBD2372424.1 type II toxin-antitoxin system PemK/MazF family toxin [Leptolyngbya sp. FACHB-238]MBD2396847.1 type II toxin-antitoxin system PemK/MazF family toxin [Leptolyngbya sp. FACHB-239]MBD2403370.1 type II toxin-antitoxin system Pem